MYKLTYSHCPVKILLFQLLTKTCCTELHIRESIGHFSIDFLKMSIEIEPEGENTHLKFWFSALK